MTHAIQKGAYPAYHCEKIRQNITYLFLYDVFNLLQITVFYRPYKFAAHFRYFDGFAKISFSHKSDWGNVTLTVEVYPSAPVVDSVGNIGDEKKVVCCYVCFNLMYN